MAEPYRVEIRDTSGNLIHILDNAFAVGYEVAINEIGRMDFSLPADDPKAAELEVGREVWLYEQGELVDIYRIASIITSHQGQEITEQVHCDQIGGMLADDIIPSKVWENQSISTILQDILTYQASPRIIFGGVDPGLNQVRSLRVEWDNLLKACFEVQKSVGGVLLIIPDEADPTIRRLYLKETWNLGEDKGQRLEYRKNLTETRRTIDRSAMVTRLYALGYGEGVNQLRLSLLMVEDETAQKSSDATYGYLTLGGEYSCYQGWSGAGDPLPSQMVVKKNGIDDSVNWSQGPSDQMLRCPIAAFDPGATYTITYRHANYLKADTADTYGLFSGTLVDKRYLSAGTLIMRARIELGKLKTPRVSYCFSAIDLAKLGVEWAFEKLKLGSKVRVIDEELGIAIADRIVRIRKNDLSDPQAFEIELANKVEDLSYDISSVRDDLGIRNQYADGQTVLTPYHQRAETDPSSPFIHQFHLSPKPVRINSVLLTWRREPYWATAKKTDRLPDSNPGSSVFDHGTKAATDVDHNHHGNIVNLPSDTPQHNHNVPIGIKNSDGRYVGFSTIIYNSSTPQHTIPAGGSYFHSINLTKGKMVCARVYVDKRSPDTTFKCLIGLSLMDSNNKIIQNFQLPFFNDWEGDDRVTFSVIGHTGPTTGAFTPKIQVMIYNNDTKNQDFQENYFWQYEETHHHATNVGNPDSSINKHGHLSNGSFDTWMITHQHPVPVGLHGHTVPISGHDHQMEYGIHQVSPQATAVTVEVDGNEVSKGLTGQEDVDILPYLQKDALGEIVRGWHSVKFTPNDRCRVESSIIVQEFIKSEKLA